MSNAYSLTRLARVVWPYPHDKERAFMAVYRAYYDASGVELQTPVVAVVGVVASEKKWLRFERRWEGVLGTYEISHHHHKHYVQNTGEFEKWKENHPDRARYAKDLILAHKLGIQNTFLVALAHESLVALGQRYDGWLDDLSGAYGVAANVCRRAIEDWVLEKYPGSSITHVFEHGDRGQNTLRQLLDREKRPRHDGYSVLQKKTREGKYIRQFEAADFLAWEARRMLEDDATGILRPRRKTAIEIAKKIPAVGYLPTTKQILDIAAEGPDFFRRRDQ